MIATATAAGDAIHRGACPPDVAWSTINAGEAIPGVVTPLTWSFFGDAVERAMKQTFCDIGVLPARDVVASPEPARRLWDVFYGRAAGNLNTFRWLGDRMPGTSGDAIEAQIFGQVRDGVRSEPVLGRYPVVAAKLPYAAMRLVGSLSRAVGPVEGFWQRSVRPGALERETSARAALGEAAVRFETVMRPHTLAAMLCQALYEQLRRAAERAGMPGLELTLVTGYGQMAETAVIADLWDVSRNRLDLDEFVRRHGYHGPDEGELSARVWRIDRGPLRSLLRAYQEMGDDRDPRLVELQRAATRRDAEAALFSALPAHARARVKLTASLAARFIPLRGTGKAAFLRCVDVARAAAWALGERLAESGSLAEPADAFMLTVAELQSPSPSRELAAMAVQRRAIRERYRGLDIPDLFYGVPEPFAVPRRDDERHGRADLVTGAPVSPGVVEATARVVRDPQSDAPLEPGEVLVCRTTDPSWASTMMLAAALVVDIGGPISHGAIVARELGIPCVTGARTATAEIATGDRVRVDGAAGTVRVLSRAGAAPVTTTITTSGNDGRKERPMENGELAVLQTLRLKGRAGAEELTAVTALEAEEVDRVVAALVAAGELRELRGAYMLTPAGREHLAALLERERASIVAEAAGAVYEDFVSVNGDFKQLAADWQTRDGEPNDHEDAAYDGGVLARLPSIHARVATIVCAASRLVPRLSPYGDRLGAALARVQAGDPSWLLRPLIDSYHTVWFELHEELIGMTGRSREAEAVAGRAE